jgi:dihydroneopterin aldolase
MDKIIMKNMKFFGYHGVYLQEQSEGQDFIIDVEMHLDLRKPGNTDNLEDTIDYSKVYDLIGQISKDNKFRLVERLADVISREILSRYKEISEITVCVKKPEAPINGEFDWVGVEIERSRDDL